MLGRSRGKASHHSGARRSVIHATIGIAAANRMSGICHPVQEGAGKAGRARKNTKSEYATGAAKIKNFETPSIKNAAAGHMMNKAANSHAKTRRVGE